MIAALGDDVEGEDDNEESSDGGELRVADGGEGEEDAGLSLNAISRASKPSTMSLMS